MEDQFEGFLFFIPIVFIRSFSDVASITIAVVVLTIEVLLILLLFFFNLIKFFQNYFIAQNSTNIILSSAITSVF